MGKNMIEKRKAMAGQGGFTLIELLVVVAILGILGGVAVFAVGNLTSDAERSACNLERRTLATAISAANSSASTTDTASNFLQSGTTLKYFTTAGVRTGTVPTTAACSSL